MSELVTLANGYDRRKKPEMLTFRRATEEDVRHFRLGDRIWFQAINGKARQLSIISQLRTWQKPSKSRHFTMEISVRYGGLHGEFDKFRNCGCGDDDFSRFLIPV